MSDQSDIVISPEGVEETLHSQISFRVTLTQGGKARLYVKPAKNAAWLDMGVCDSIEEAEKTLGSRMLLMGGLFHDTKKTLDVIFRTPKE